MPSAEHLCQVVGRLLGQGEGREKARRKQGGGIGRVDQRADQAWEAGRGCDLQMGTEIQPSNVLF